MTASLPMVNEPGTKPDPDPTVRTVDQLLREILALRELLEARLTSAEHGSARLERLLDHLPEELRRDVTGLKELHEKQFGERFEGIQRQFDSVLRQFEQQDKRTEQTSREAKEAVATAFAASKEAVAAALQAAKELGAAQNTANTQAAEKSDKQTRDLLEQLRILQNTTADSLAGQLRTNAANTDGKISDLKDSVTGLATVVTSIQGRTTGQGQSWIVLLGAVGLISTLVSIGAVIVAVAK